MSNLVRWTEGDLRSYLQAAGSAARDHPYPGVVPTGPIPPPLGAVYVRQQVRPHGQDAAPPSRHLQAAPVPAEAILGRDRTCVVLAGPGGGKSSLLRTALAASAGRWLDGQVDTAVPVLVPACDLAASRLPLPEALARIVTAELSETGLLERLPADFFRAEPQPGVPWLVLVDGLDEIVDPAARRRVLATVAAAAADGHSPYRFVVATRPVSAGELDVLGRAVPRYLLQPFDPEDLRGFVAGWFAALALPDPERAAEAFTSALGRTRLAELARTPLVATILCQLHAAAPGRELPAGRSEVYRRFVDLVHERQHASGSGGITTQTRATLERYGEHALSRAQHTLDHIQPLIAYLAAQRHAGNTAPAVDVLAGQPDAARPARVPAKAWAQFLGESLRRSGLMTVHAGEFAFWHQTFLEYLAACHTGRDEHASAQAFRALFDGRWGRSPLSPSLSKSWMPPWRDDSYVGFLLDAWDGTDAYPAQALHLIATRGGLDGCMFIATQAALGTLLPDHVTSAAADTLAVLIDNPDRPGRNFQHAALMLLGSVAGIQLEDDRPDPDWNRRRAAEALEKLGDPRGPDILTAFANNRGIDGEYRLWAAKALVKLGDPRGPDILAALADDPDLDTRDRRPAAEALAGLGDPRGPDILATLADDPDFEKELFLTKALIRAELGDEHVAGTLDTLANDPDLDSEHRLWAAEALVGLRDGRAAAPRKPRWKRKQRPR